MRVIPMDLSDRVTNLWNQARDIWLAGGWAMVGIAVIALLMFAVGFQVLLKLKAKGLVSLSERTWRRWLERPAERRGPLGRLLAQVTGGSLRSDDEIAAFFAELRTTETLPFDRDLKVMKVCVSAAPLVGLLGTVTGMLATFGALASGSGGEKTMGLIAKGISEALITTETGLVIALPGLFFQYGISRRFEKYKAFLTHLETVCLQSLHRRQGRPQAPDLRFHAAQSLARSIQEELARRQARA